MDMRPLFRTILASTLAVMTLPTLEAGNLRMISSRDGISNNSVLCLNQDAEGFIWLGTCEGLNIWDGQHMGCYPPADSGMQPLSGNLIEKIHSTLDRYSWLRTNYGLDLMHHDQVIEQHKEFQGIYFLISRRKSETVVLTQGNTFYGYCEEDSSFRRIETLFPFDRYITSWAGVSDSVYIFRTDGIYRTNFAARKAGEPSRLGTLECIQPMTLSYAFADRDSVLLIDSRGVLYAFDPKSEVLEYIADIRNEIEHYGKVSYAIRYGDDFLVSFLFDGVTKLRFTPESPRKYETERLDINCGVFCLLKDAKQNIVWIGSDGQGLFMYANDELSFHSYTYDKLPYNLSKPVRSLLLDSRGSCGLPPRGRVSFRFRTSPRVASRRSSSRSTVPGPGCPTMRSLRWRRVPAALCGLVPRDTVSTISRFRADLSGPWAGIFRRIFVISMRFGRAIGIRCGLPRWVVGFSG